jgi:hypothetical protein
LLFAADEVTLIPNPRLSEPDRRLELTRQIAEHAIRIGERLLVENADLRRQLAARSRKKSA